VALVFQDAHPVLQLSLDLPAIPPISFDRRLIQQALGNLLTNTMKYSVGAPRAKISVVAENDAVQIIVRDHGIGIPAPDREGIFDDYVRAGNVGERPGTGLGLSIVQQIASLHGGNVDIVETDGQGASIRITLPCG
jgi:signal transduction histidine kinase